MRIYVTGANCAPYQFEEAAIRLERKGYTPLLSQWFIPQGCSDIVALRRSLETMLHCEALADINPGQGDKRSSGRWPSTSTCRSARFPPGWPREHAGGRASVTTREPGVLKGRA